MIQKNADQHPAPDQQPEAQPAVAALHRESTARRISWWTLLVMVFLVPLLMTDFTFPGLHARLAFSSVELVKLSLEQMLVLVALGAWAWDLLRRGGQIRRTPIDWLILGLILWVGITTITSIHWPTALFGTSGRYEGFVTFVTYAIIYFLVLQLADSGARVRQLAQSLFFASVIVAIYGLLQFTGIVFLPEDLPWDETNRAFSTYGNPNMLGGFLVFSVTVALGLALQERRLSWRLVYWVGFGLNGLALVVSFTRGAWIGGAISLILLGIMAWRQHTHMRRIDWLPAGAFGLGAIAIIVRSFWSAGEVMNFGRRLASIFQFTSGSGQTRTEIWHAAAAAIRDRPYVGWGADTFGLVFSKFKPVEYVRDAGGSSVADNAHDYPLHLASGVGILGALLFYGVCIWAAVRSWRTVFGRPGGPTRIVLGAFWAASAGYLFHLLFSLSVPGVTFLLWVALALVLGPSARSREVPARRWGTAGAAVVLLVAALGIAGQAVVLAADRSYVDAREEFSLSAAERATAATRAIDLFPYNSDYRSALASAYRDLVTIDLGAVAQAQRKNEDTAPPLQELEQSFAKAQSAYEDAIEFSPYDYANYVNLASLYNSAGSALDPTYYEDAASTAERGLEVMPYGTAIRVQLARTLHATGRTAEAIETLAYCLSIDPRDGSAALELARIYEKQGQTTEALAVLRSVEALAPGQAGIAPAIRALESATPMP